MSGVNVYCSYYWFCIFVVYFYSFYNFLFLRVGKIGFVVLDKKVKMNNVFKGINKF